MATGGTLSDKMYVYDIATDIWTESLQSLPDVMGIEHIIIKEGYS